MREKREVDKWVKVLPRNYAGGWKGERLTNISETQSASFCCTFSAGSSSLCRQFCPRPATGDFGARAVVGAQAGPQVTARSESTRQPWPACVRRKWKTTEQSEELSIAPRRPTRQSLKSCYYSSPDSNLPVHLLFSSSRPFHNKKMRLVSSSPITSPCSLRSLQLTAFQKSPITSLSCWGPHIFLPQCREENSLCQEHPMGRRMLSQKKTRGSCMMGSHGGLPLLH